MVPINDTVEFDTLSQVHEDSTLSKQSDADGNNQDIRGQLPKKRMTITTC